jgi:D-glycero-D-manno-heptose 1,7-bisphosphate phosphatase
MLAEETKISYKEIMSYLSKALFLDRDGIIIEDAGYTKDPNLVVLIPEIIPVIKKAHEKQYKIIVVTNQSGLGRHSISLDNYTQVTHRMFELLEKETSLHFSAVYFAPFYEQVSAHSLLPSQHFFSLENPWNIPHKGLWSFQWRKPQLGMIQQAEKDFSLDLHQSFLIGDRWTDQLLALSSPIKKGFWYCSEKPNLEGMNDKDSTGSLDKIHPVYNLTEVLPFL